MRTVLDESIRRLAARRSKLAGINAEDVVRSRLLLKGLLMVERIEQGWKITRGKGGRVLGASPLAKLRGDWRAIAPGGLSVLCEAKYRPARLVFSDLELHQVAALDMHANLGGVSLLAWVNAAGVHIMRWPVPGFEARTSL